MLILKTKSIIFKLNNEKLPSDVIMMIEIEFRELGSLSNETINKYRVELECT